MRVRGFSCQVLWVNPEKFSFTPKPLNLAFGTKLEKEKKRQLREPEKLPQTMEKDQTINKNKLTISIIFTCFTLLVITFVFNFYLDGERKPPGGSRVALSQCVLSYADWIDHHTAIHQKSFPIASLKSLDDFQSVGISTFPTRLERTEFGFFWGVIDWLDPKKNCRIEFNGNTWACKIHGEISEFRMKFSGKLRYRIIRGFWRNVDKIK